jgi:hypothetical protein
VDADHKLTITGSDDPKQHGQNNCSGAGKGRQTQNNSCNQAVRPAGLAVPSNKRPEKQHSKNEQLKRRSFMMKTILTLALATAMGFLGTAPRAFAAAGDLNAFKLVVSAGAATCLPAAVGRVTIHDLGPVQNMHVELAGLPAKTEFAAFLIQVPNKPFGLVWYQGDIITDRHGHGIGDFTGIFSEETFINGPGVAPAPSVFPDDATSNPATAPIQVYHLGLWFADANDASKAGCAATVTPFDGDHQAGIQVLNTSTFADDQGPLRNLK